MNIEFVCPTAGYEPRNYNILILLKGIITEQNGNAAVPALITQKVVKRKVDVPTCGGVNEFDSGEIAWTGGNPYDNTITGPAANGCYHPIEPDKARKVEDKCIQSLPEAGGLSQL